MLCLTIKVRALSLRHYDRLVLWEGSRYQWDVQNHTQRSRIFDNGRYIDLDTNILFLFNVRHFNVAVLEIQTNNRDGTIHIDKNLPHKS